MATSNKKEHEIYIVKQGDRDVRLWDEELYVLYQEVCDEVFGEGAVEIKPAEPSHAITSFGFVDDFKYDNY